MADNPEPIEVSIIARIKGLLDGLGQATSGVKKATDEIGGSLGGLERMVTNLKAPFLALTALLAGGALFKGAIDETLQWTNEVGTLARTLGITTREASGLAVALDDLGVSSDTYLNASRMMVRQINSGGEGFKKLGIDVKDAHGNLKPTPQLMTEVMDKLKGMRQGVDQQAAGMAIFGRGWGEAQQLLRMTSERMEEAKKRAEELHLVVGPEGVAQARAYKEAMNDLHDIQQSLSYQVGSTLLPILTRFGAWLGNYGPQMAEGFGYAIKGIISGFYALKAAVETVTIWMTAMVMSLVEGFGTVGKVLWRLIKLDFKGAVDAAKQGGQDLKNEFLAAAQGTGDAWKNMAGATAQIWSPAKIKDGKVGDAGGTGGFDPDKGTDKSDEILAKFKLQLEEKKSEEGNWFTWSTARELAFWSEKLDQVKVGSKAYLAILTEENKLKRKLAEEEQAKAKADFDLRMAKEQEGSLERVALAQQEALRLAGVYGQDSKQYLEALAKVEKAKQDHASKMREIDQLVADNQRDARLAALDLEQSIIQDEASMGLVSQKQRIAAELAYENQVFQIKLEAARKAAELEPDPVKHQQLLNQIAQLERQHTARVSQINRQATQERWGQWKGFFDSMTGGFGSAVRGLIRGTMDWGTALMTVLDSALDGVINFFVQWGIQAATTALANQAVGAASRAAEGAGAAALWAVNAASSVAAIPVVGWAMAPEVAAAAYGQGMGWASLASAAGGWDRVPKDQLASIHKDEMVLSSPLATKIRNMTDGGQGGGGETHVHLHGAVIDGAWWQKHQGNIVRVIGDAAKNRRLR